MAGLSSMGTAMAFGYFLYLKDAPFKKLNERLGNFEDSNDIRITAKQILILAPKSCRCKVDENDSFKYKNDLESIVDDVAGVQNRKYTLSVYEAKCQAEKEDEAKSQFFAVDMAQCLDCLPRLEEFRVIDGNVKNLIHNQFVQVLASLLGSERPFRKRYVILNYSENENIVDVIKNYKNAEPIISHLEFPLETKNLGKGLAYWFYYNYLCLVLPYLVDGIKEWETKQNNMYRILPTLFLLVPVSCHTDNFMELPNPGNIDCLPYGLEPVVITAGTTKKRPYQKNIIRLWDETQTCYCIMEYATPVRQLYRMCNDYFKVTSWTEREMREERSNFTDVLIGLLRRNEEHKKLCKVIVLNDDEDFVFSKVMLKKINHC